MASRDAVQDLPELTRGRVALLAVLGVWLLLQVLVPLRHLLYPGSPSWTEEGHRFAWQMKLRDKIADPNFIILDPETGQRWFVRPTEYLRRHQQSMETRPGMILQFAHHLEDLWRTEHGVEDAEVRVRVCASLNGRPPALLIDPNRDLTEIQRSIRAADWILPLEVPFERPENRKYRVDLAC